MICKLFEIRDEGTFIVAMAVQLSPSNNKDQYLLARAGYGTKELEQGEYIWVSMIDGGQGKSFSDPYDWAGSRTMNVAHQYIKNNWAKLKSGEVVDVSFILGESESPKLSEQNLHFLGGE